MPDITMCANSECQLREMCYRFRAVPSKHRQSYCVFTTTDAGCIHFARINDDDELAPMVIHKNK